MLAISGPARYFFLRQPYGVKETVSNWPPDIKPLQQPDNWVCVAVYLTAEENGWRAEAARTEDDLRKDASGAFLLTRETTLGLAPQEGRRSGVVLDLLGVRVVSSGGSGPDYATHLVVRVAGGMGMGAPKLPLVVPMSALVLSAYVEHQDKAEAQLDLRLTPAELAIMPPYFQDPIIERHANRTLDQTILSVRHRHEIKPEVIAGRVTLYGYSELTTVGDLAAEALRETPGVIEVDDRLVYGENLMEQVRAAFDAKGYDYVGVRYENGLIELDGTVPDAKTVHTLRDLALKVTGVRGVVVNQLAVLAPVPDEVEGPDEVHAAAERFAPEASVGAAAMAGANAASPGPGMNKQGTIEEQAARRDASLKTM